MKKIAILSVILTFGLGAYAMDIPPSVGQLINDVGNMQNTESQLKLLQEDRFRKEEYNEFKDMKQVKEARNKKIQLEQNYREIQNQQQSQINGYNQDINFVKENGRIILKRVD
ncbi:MAG: hypothetical protein VZR09_03825 [Candidatus Gastranaerophilaceae bacterium]|nr:hypothetical protein [Candidatus Gastranaerophilaceae bacterium]